MINMLTAWLATVVLGGLIDRLIQPRRPHPRARSGWMIQAGLAGMGLSALLLLTHRPGFAASLLLALHLLVVLVNNAKVKALREPFVFTDFALFSQAIRYPRLYLPFLGILPALAALTAMVLAIYTGLTLEPSLLDGASPGRFALMLAALAASSASLLWLGIRQAGEPQLEPLADLARFGLLPSLLLYRLAEHRHDPHRTDHPARRAQPAPPRGATGAKRPHIIAVQSESFFDARRVYPDIAADVLAHFDALSSQAIAHGQLVVPAWGANTMRTEFAFLSGLSEQHLGVHRFNPYRRFARHNWPTVASQLRDMGYRTVCIHPHPAGFFARDRVFPLLGFDCFLDLKAFSGAEKFGPYVSDAAVTDKINEILAAAQQPTFVFAITMENHGPLHLEQVAADDIASLYTTPPPDGFDDLTVYLRHLRNADRMLAELTQTTTATQDDRLVCFYGDHVPSMPDVYHATSFSDGHSDYLIWRRNAEARPPERLPVEDLGRRLLQAAGLVP